MIPVFFDCFPIKTFCFTCHSCDFGLGGTSGYALFLKYSLETFSESLQGTLEDDILVPTEAPRKAPTGSLIETSIESTTYGPTEALAEVPNIVLTTALRGLVETS